MSDTESPSPMGGSHRRGRKVAAPTLALLLLVAACGADTDDSGSPSIVTTTTILGDVLDDVVGDHGDVDVLMPVGADPHEFALSVRQAAALQEADLIVVNGLDFEAGLLDAVAAAEEAGVPVLHLGEDLDPRPFGDHEAGPPDDHDGELDPHWFTDPTRMAGAARLMAEAAVEHADAPEAVTENAEAVASDLRALDQEVRTVLARVPADDRELVTNHEVFGYFADKYDLTVIGTVVPGGTTLSQTSPAALADLADTIRESDVPAIFVETSSSSDLAAALADEVGRPVEIVDLYTESLGEPGSDGDSYAGMIRTDAQRMADALT